MHPFPKIEGSYFPSVNSFLKNARGKWSIETCRDRMQSYFDGNPEEMEFYFCADDQSLRVIEFMKVVEAAAGVSQENKMTIEITTKDAILYIKMSPWWRHHVRRSLLTALLRSGRYYAEDSAKSFDSALNSIDHTSKTRKAIDMFLSGKTAVKNKSVDKNFGGWYALFSQVNFDPSKILTRTKRNKVVKQ